MRVSAINIFRNIIDDIKNAATSKYVAIYMHGMIVTASIINAFIDNLGLKVGGKASAVFKFYNVMVSVD